MPTSNPDNPTVKTPTSAGPVSSRDGLYFIMNSSRARKVTSYSDTKNGDIWLILDSLTLSFTRDQWNQMVNVVNAAAAAPAKKGRNGFTEWFTEPLVDEEGA